MKLDLGCGPKEKEGYIGLDVVDFGHNIVSNFEKDTLPFVANEVDYIYCHHVIEHLRDVRNCFNECWRVLKPNGKLEIFVPYGFWEGAVCPVHHQIITPSWFGWFKKEDNWERYGYRVWDLELVKNIKNNVGVNYEVHAIMSPKK